MEYTVTDFIGNIGCIMILVAYILIQTKKMSPEGISFSVINIVGAIFIIVSLVYSFNLSAFIIYVFWVLVSFYGIMNYIIGHAKKITTKNFK